MVGRRSAEAAGLYLPKVRRFGSGFDRSGEAGCEEEERRRNGA